MRGEEWSKEKKIIPELRGQNLTKSTGEAA